MTIKSKYTSLNTIIAKVYRDMGMSDELDISDAVEWGAEAIELIGSAYSKTASEAGMIIPVVITVYQDRTFSFIMKTPPAAVLIKKAVGVESGSAVPNKQK